MHGAEIFGADGVKGVTWVNRIKYLGNEIFDDYLDEKSNTIAFCDRCVCRACLYWWSNRCPYGKCYDDYRAKIEPYNKIYPDKPPRTGWSNWNKLGEQEHWCRGGNSISCKLL